MSDSYDLKISHEQAREIPMVDLAFEVLKAANTPFYYRDLMSEISKIKGFTEAEVMQVIAQLYTEINVDGRFACVGNNLWGLKRWYPVDNKDGELGSNKRPRIINDDDDLDEEEYVEDEEEGYVVEEDDFDSFDEDRDEILGEEEEAFDTDELDEELDESEENVESEEDLDSDADEAEFEEDLAEDDFDDETGNKK